MHRRDCSGPHALRRTPASPTARRRLRWVLGPLLTVLVLAPAAAVAAGAPSRTSLNRLDETIADRIDANNIPGFAVAVVSGKRTVHVRGFGDADGSGRSVTGRTPFVLGSSAKTITALTVMQLVDAGKVRLDAPVRRYVPEFQVHDETASERITVRHLVQQTSGLPETAGGPLLRSLGGGTPLEVIDELRDTKLASDPGEEFRYSNGNFVLAGLVVERASGEPFGRYVERHVFAPLGMDRSFVSIEPARRAGLAVGHRYWFGFAREHGPTFPSELQPAGNLISTAEDLGRYLSLYLNDGVVNGRRLISSRSLRTLLTPGHKADLGPWAGDPPSSYAMGWFAGGPWREQALLHPGDTPDSSSMLVLLPKRDWAVATLMNAGNELDIPGNPAAMDRASRNAVDALLGEPVEGTSLKTFYVYFDLVVLLLFALAVYGLFRAARALRRHAPPRHRAKAFGGIAARAAAGGLLLAAPPLLAVGWSGAFLWSPDLALVALVLGGLLVVTALVRLVWLMRVRAPPAAQPRPHPRPAEPSWTP
jgi:CubicO group peptidase (beta-lactamase class C family)